MKVLQLNYSECVREYYSMRLYQNDWEEFRDQQKEHPETWEAIKDLTYDDLVDLYENHKLDSIHWTEKTYYGTEYENDLETILIDWMRDGALAGDSYDCTYIDDSSEEELVLEEGER